MVTSTNVLDFLTTNTKLTMYAANAVQRHPEYLHSFANTASLSKSIDIKNDDINHFLNCLLQSNCMSFENVSTECLMIYIKTYKIFNRILKIYKDQQTSTMIIFQNGIYYCDQNTLTKISFEDFIREIHHIQNSEYRFQLSCSQIKMPSWQSFRNLVFRQPTLINKIPPKNLGLCWHQIVNRKIDLLHSMLLTKMENI